jgi:hypothetical protein
MTKFNIALSELTRRKLDFVSEAERSGGPNHFTLFPRRVYPLVLARMNFDVENRQSRRCSIMLNNVFEQKNLAQ